MSEYHYNFEFFSNLSSDLNNYEQIRPLVFQLFIALKKIYMNRIGSFFYKIFHNFSKSILKTESNYEQDLFVKRLKYQILQIKLGTMLNVLLKKLQFNQIYFLSKLSLKINSLKVIYSHDNFLNILSNKELRRHTNFAAYLKLVYVIRFNHSRNLILKSYFYKFKQLIADWEPEIKKIFKNLVNKKIYDQGKNFNFKKKVFQLWKCNVMCIKNLIDLDNNSFESDNSVIKLTYLIINKILKIKQEIFCRLRNIIREDYTSNNNAGFFKSITDELNVINSIVSFKTKENYLINPPTDIKQLSLLYTNSFNNLQQSLGDNIRHYKSLQYLKGVIKLYSRNFVEKSLYTLFYRWKTKSDLIGYDILNDEIQSLYLLKKQKTFSLLEKILNRFIYCNQYFFCVFLERLNRNAKLKNTLSDYGKFYNKIESMISDDDTKTMILHNRSVFNKSIILRKVIAIANKIKYESPRIDKFNKIVKNDFFKINSCLIKWKKYTIYYLKIEKTKNIRISQFYFYFQVIINQISSNFFRKLKKIQLYKKQFSYDVKVNFENLFTLISLHEKKQKSFFISKMIRIDKDMNTTKMLMLKKITFNKKYFDKFGIRIILKNRFKKWERNTIKIETFKMISKQKIRKDFNFKSKLIFCIYRFMLIIKNIFLKKKFGLLKQRFKKKDKPSIDFLVNQNQARVCLELEKQDNELTDLFNKKRLALFSSDVILIVFYKRHINFKSNSYYFRKWKSTVISEKTETFTSLQNTKKNIITEYEFLVNELEDKKQTIEKIKEEFDILKKNFCKNCIQDDMSINCKQSNEFYVSNENLEMSRPNNETIKTQLEEKNKLIHQKAIVNNIVEMEEKINKLKIEYDQKLDSNEKFLKIYEEKKHELNSIKSEILSKFKDVKKK